MHVLRLLVGDKSCQKPRFELLECQPHAYSHVCISGLANRRYVDYLSVNPMPTHLCAFQVLPTDTV